MTNHDRDCWLDRGCLALFFGTVILGHLLTSTTRRPAAQTIGVAEFRPAGPAGQSIGPTVRFHLPSSYRASYSQGYPDVEAGVVDAKGDRVFYVTVQLASVVREVEGETLLQAFSRKRNAAGDANRPDVSAEFRTSNRGSIWHQRYTEVFRDQPVRVSGGKGQSERLKVLRYAEEWRGLLLDLEFYISAEREPELEPLIWDLVQTMEFTERSGS